MKIKAMIPLLAFLAVIALAAVPLLQGKDPKALPSVLIGKPAPEFTLPPAVGKKGFSRADIRDAKAPVIVNFFASWCITCSAEQRVLLRAAHETGIKVYGIDYKDEKPAVAAWLERHGNPFKATGFDADGRVAIDWGVYGVPETFVLDRHGIIRHKFVGPLTRDDYETTLRPLLEELKK